MKAVPLRFFPSRSVAPLPRPIFLSDPGAPVVMSGDAKRYPRGTVMIVSGFLLPQEVTSQSGADGGNVGSSVGQKKKC